VSGLPFSNATAARVFMTVSLQAGAGRASTDANYAGEFAPRAGACFDDALAAETAASASSSSLRLMIRRAARAARSKARLTRGVPEGSLSISCCCRSTMRASSAKARSVMSFRRGGVAEPPGPHRRPEVMGRALGFRREAVEHDVGWRANRKVAARLACAQRDPRMDRGPKLEELPAVDLAVEISRRFVDRGGIDVVHQPLRAHHVAVDLHLQRRLGAAAARKRRLVDVYDAGEVENVVDQQLIVGPDVKHSVNAGPTGFDVLTKVGDQCRISERRLAEPDEDKSMDFARGQIPSAEVAADGCIARHVGASAIGRETDAVIAALDVVADDLAG